MQKGGRDPAFLRCLYEGTDALLGGLLACRLHMRRTICLGGREAPRLAREGPPFPPSPPSLPQRAFIFSRVSSLKKGMA